MTRFGIIGTGKIVETFLAAAHTVPEFELVAVYSRTMAKAKQFAEQHGAALAFDDIEQMAAEPSIDAIYIASPNALHCQQALTVMQHNKHVLCEKPISANKHETELMFACAQAHNVVLMEAMKSIALPNYDLVRQYLPELGTIRAVHSHYCQYSSRYDRLLAGEVLNAFKPELANGALMDLGVYALYPVLDWFGTPQQVDAQAVKLTTGVDGMGSVLLRYNDFIATVTYSKISDMALPSEIQGEQGSLLIDHISEFNKLTLVRRDGRKEVLAESAEAHPMRYELIAFIERLQQPSANTATPLSLLVSDVMTTIRQRIGLTFPADQQY